MGARVSLRSPLVKDTQKQKKLKFLTDFFFDKRRLELFMGCNIQTNHHEKGRDKKQGNKQKHLSLGVAPPPPSLHLEDGLKRA